MLRNIVQGLKNLWTWIPYIWRDRQYDGVFIYAILWKKLDLMYKFYASDKCYSVVTEKDLRNMYIARELCCRIFNEDYAPFINGDFIVPKQFIGLPDYEYYMQKQDIELLGKILKSQSLSWWD